MLPAPAITANIISDIFQRTGALAQKIFVQEKNFLVNNFDDFR